MKKHNFNAGPSILPREVIEKTAQAVLDFNGSGLSIMEISHRAKDFQPVVDEAVALFKELLNIPEGYSVLFLGGGASLEFCMIPFNFLEKKAAYLNTGVWAKKAMKENETRKRKRGASTISQQTAKNVFLWPQSSWVRKGLEVYFTFLIELFWPKERIMEVYLNSIEMGKGIYGAQAAAKYKFNTTAAKLTKGQCALIAATLPNPIRFNSAKPSAYILKRQKKILRLMNLVPKFPPEGKAAKKEIKKKKKK